MITVIQEGLLELDNKLANAIQGLIGGELNLPEPVNPMQQMIMNLIAQKMQPIQDQEILIKDAQGKFKGA